MIQSPDIGFVYEQLRSVHPSTIEDFHRRIPDLLYPWNAASEDPEGYIVPYSCGPHSVAGFKAWKRLACPSNVLEIGFNQGVSASIMLSIGIETVTSCEARKSSQVTESASRVSGKYPGRFKLINEPSGTFEIPPDIDSAFIDGQHDCDSIIRDIEFCKRHGITDFLFDDIFPLHGDTMEAIRISGLTVEAIVGNFCIASAVDRSGFVRV